MAKKQTNWRLEETMIEDHQQIAQAKDVKPVAYARQVLEEAHERDLKKYKLIPAKEKVKNKKQKR